MEHKNKMRGVDGRPDDKLPPFTSEFDCDSENRLEVLKKNQVILDITTSHLRRIPTAIAKQGDDIGQSYWSIDILQKLPAFAALTDLGKLIAAHADDDGLVTKIGLAAAMAEYLEDECAEAIVVGYASIYDGMGHALGGYGGMGRDMVMPGGYAGTRRLVV